MCSPLARTLCVPGLRLQAHTIMKSLAQELADAVIAYDKAIAACLDHPEKLSSFCTAQGEDLDMLYLAMTQLAEKVKREGTPQS